jgi:phenylacetate-coenzyme A ligase PaaK-like adenylate-forming protein
VGQATHLFYFAEWCREELAEGARGLLQASVLAHGCSFAPLTPRMKAEIESVWGCRAHDCYSVTEMGFAVALECPLRAGLHVNELDVLVEVVDPESGEPVEEGEEGVLVLTSLTRRGMPILRYWTGDVAKCLGRVCECGSADNMLVSGVKRRISTPPPS